METKEQKKKQILSLFFKKTVNSHQLLPTIENMIQLTEKNKDLLERVLRNGMNGSYYEHGEMPGVDGLDRILAKQENQISEKIAEQIADYYELYLSDLLEIINDEDECKEWLACRAHPFDDPW